VSKTASRPIVEAWRLLERVGEAGNCVVGALAPPSAEGGASTAFGALAVTFCGDEVVTGGVWQACAFWGFSLLFVGSHPQKTFLTIQ
jgi:hypothetical protein